METGATSLLSVLSSDHHSLASSLADPALAASGHGALTLREQLVADLVRHFVAEEQYLYPAVRERVVDGAAAAERGDARDRAIEHQLRELEHVSDGAALADLLARISRAFDVHIREQEEELAALRDCLDAATLEELGRGVLGAEQLAPTRPRSVAPEQPVLNKVISLVSGFVDKVRDHYAGRGAD